MSMLDPGRRLLVLDDEVAVGQIVAMAARGAGFEARATTSATEFFDMLAEWQPTHLAIDLMMPDMDGIEVLRRLGEDHCQARTIVMSGVGGQILGAARRLASEHGLDIAGVLTKPFSPRDLRTLLSSTGPAPGADRDAGNPDFVVTEAELRRALDERELQVYYQPRVECLSGRLVGFEALLRWPHPGAGMIMPDRFIDLAERCGIIAELTDYVVEQAFTWLAHSHPGGSWALSVNLSPRMLADLGVADHLLEIGRRLDIDPQRIVFEVTESVAMERPTVTLDVLTRLRINGFQLAIDDFGSGYSSMLQLVRLPFSELKVDKSFALRASQSTESRAVIKAAVDLGHSLGLTVTAEGVDDQATLSFLCSVGCDVAQGFLFSRALPAELADAWLEQRRLA
ncbi:EAL domain-containing response regulator [Solimonas marina]|uniref:EAL domain-containing response regulator n=1 Tax=Solimonas marina TaxID=2714601 RepID=A0A969WAK2_9GAMM|nr:EAL domain-containing response regulator [Solimonas marina]NKF22964.1 EAL domain-containing response regulator [Solimonas marina]